MAHIEMIEDFVFQTQLAVRVTDLNYGNHVGNTEFVSLLHEARMRFLKHFGFSEKDIDGKGLIISDFAVSYKSQSFYGDMLKFEMGAGNFKKNGCDLFCRVFNNKNNALVLLAKTSIVFFDSAENKVAKTPEAFSRLFVK